MGHDLSCVLDAWSWDWRSVFRTLCRAALAETALRTCLYTGECQRREYGRLEHGVEFAWGEAEVRLADAPPSKLQVWGRRLPVRSLSSLSRVDVETLKRLEVM